MFRRFIVFLASSLFTLFLLLTVTTAAIAITVTPSNIKTWLKNSKLYDGFVDAVLTSTKNATASTPGTGADNQLNDPALQAAAKAAFTPEFLQKSTENFIDGSFVWLDGKSPKPTFEIDMTSAKQNFANAVGKYALERYNGLPACARGQLPDTSDVLSITCKPAGLDITATVNQQVNELATSKDVLGDPVITADSLSSQDKAQTKTFSERYSQYPKIYRFSKMAPLILGGLSLLMAVIIIFVSADRRRGLRKTGTSLVVVAVMLFIGIWLANFGMQRAQSALTKVSTPETDLAQSTALSVIRDINGSIARVSTYFGVAFLLIAGGLFVYLFITRDKTAPKPSKPSETPEKADDANKKPEETKNQPVPDAAPKPEKPEPEPPKDEPPKPPAKT